MQSHQQQKDFLVSCVSEQEKKRQYTKSVISRRKITKNYFIPINGIRRKVCLKFLLKTLDISEKLIRYSYENKTGLITANIDCRGNQTPPNKTAPELSSNVEAFISSLPAVPSHYCRAGSTRKYLPSDFKNLSSLFRLYKSLRKKNQAQSVSDKVFKKIFHTKFNIGFHVPKKDKCVVCENFKNTPESDLSENQILKFKKHEVEVKFSKSIHLAAQENAKACKTFVCTSFDLQKVLNTPHGQSMLLYYSRKYSMYNETFYESGTRKGFCYLWGEKDGKRGANEICTILLKYLQVVDKRGYVKEINLFCDSCPGQNKNHQILASILWFLQTSVAVEKICIVYLEPGHTYMPVDSVHATIESNLKNKIIWAPSEWPTVIVNSRTQPEPYEVEVMKHTDFKDFKSLQKNFFPLIKKDNTGKNIKLSELKQFEFEKNSYTVRAKSSLDPESEEINICVQGIKTRRATNLLTSLTSLYNDELKLSSKKYEDLMNLIKNNVIPNRYHEEYVKMVSDTLVPDELAETDDED